jgi:hypothetical protein
MPRRKHMVIIGSGLLLFAAPFSLLASAQSQSNTSMRKITLARCASGFNQTAERVFANSGSKTWKEYEKVEDVPPLGLDDDEQMFAVSANNHGIKRVRLIQHNEDASMLYTYCFGPAGSLGSLRYELRTDWGWGYAEERMLGPSGEIVQRTTRFFDTASNQKIPRPRQADDVPNFLKPTIYRSFDSLPFIAAFKSVRVNAPKK